VQITEGGPLSLLIICCLTFSSRLNQDCHILEIFIPLNLMTKSGLLDIGDLYFFERVMKIDSCMYYSSLRGL